MNNLALIGVMDTCQSILPLLRVVRKGIFPIIQIGIPILLIILGTLDLAKAVISSDDKEVKAATGRLTKRMIYAAVIFFMTTIVALVMNIVAAGGSEGAASGQDVEGWQSCWNQAA